jgi:hypothetical protein
LVWISTVDNVQADVVSRLRLCDIPSDPACSTLTHLQTTNWVPPSQDDPLWEEEFLEGILLGH